MSYKTCSEWPELMELAPDLQFKHLSVQEAQLPSEAVARIPASIPLGETEICCDVDRHVFNAAHTHPGRDRSAHRHALVRGARVGDLRSRRRRARRLDLHVANPRQRRLSL